MRPSPRIKSRFRAAMENAHFMTQFEGLTGTLDSDGTVNQNPTTGLASGYIWVRPSAGGVPLAVRNVNVRTDIANVPVICERLAGGEYQVRQVEPVKGFIAFGENAPSFNVPDQRGEFMRMVVPPRMLGGGRMRLAAENTLVFTHDDFWYIDSAGNEKFAPAGTHTVTITAPAAVSSIDQHRITRITFNPDATSPGFVAFNGTSQAVSSPLYAYDIRNVSITAGYISLGAVRVATGDTTITDSSAIYDYRYQVNPDLRGLMANLPRSASVTTTNATATDIATVAVAELQAVTITAEVLGTKSDFTLACGGTITGAFRRASGGNVTVAGTPLAVVSADAGFPAVPFDLVADTGNQTVDIRVTGIASTTINWKVTYKVLYS